MPRNIYSANSAINRKDDHVAAFCPLVYAVDMI